MKSVFRTQLSAAILAIAIIVSFHSAALAQDKAAKIDQLISLYNKYGEFNGSALVADNGQAVLKKGYGLANMEWNIPNTPDTKFRLGSITKQFTATLILQLAEQGKIKLDAKVIDYLPDYRKDTGSKVTIHNLLSHTSGIPNYTALPGFFQNVSRDAADALEDHRPLRGINQRGDVAGLELERLALQGLVTQDVPAERRDHTPRARQRCARLRLGGAVELVRRRPKALPLLALGVGLATLLALLDLRLADPGADRPLASMVSLALPLICLGPVWWLSRRAPDLQAAK
jgi:hypothetical protein